jgi:pimeloyl-ACP methyl ester carboxylesterase
VAAAEQLGQLGGLVHAGRLRTADAGPAGRSRNGRTGPGEPERPGREDLEQVADHTTEIITALDNKPAVIGHSTGGLLAQMLAGRGLAAATVAIDPGVFRGVLPLPASVQLG